MPKFLIYSYTIAIILEIQPAISIPNNKNLITQKIVETMKSRGFTPLVISFKESTDSVLNSVLQQSFNDRASKISAITKALKSHCQKSQNDVLEYLKSNSIAFKSYWITNKIVILNATLDTLNYLESSLSVQEIRDPLVIKLEKAEWNNKIHSVVIPKASSEVQWGIQKVNAPEFWGFDCHGEGITVATIDSGVRGTHRILRDNFLGDFGWYDPLNGTGSPVDLIGHGTHAMGVLVGQEGYGMAPGSKWMACRACSETCNEQDLLSCGQFILCPTDPFGFEEDCSKAPHVVSNSWGTDEYNPFYDDIISAWRAADIIPVFSSGYGPDNDGPSCQSVGSPAHSISVITVGSLTFNDSLAKFSGMGPSPSSEQVKPDLSAPGESTLSASHLGDDEFISKSGSVISGSHVAGAAALLLSQIPTLNYKQVSESLYLNAIKQGLEGLDENCGGLNEDNFPNNAFGNGRAFLTYWYIPEPSEDPIGFD